MTNSWEARSTRRFQTLLVKHSLRKEYKLLLALKRGKQAHLPIGRLEKVCHLFRVRNKAVVRVTFEEPEASLHLLTCPRPVHWLSGTVPQQHIVSCPVGGNWGVVPAASKGVLEIVAVVVAEWLPNVRLSGIFLVEPVIVHFHVGIWLRWRLLC